MTQRNSEDWKQTWSLGASHVRGISNHGPEFGAKHKDQVGSVTRKSTSTLTHSIQYTLVMTNRAMENISFQWENSLYKL